MQRYTVYLYLETALHVSGSTSTHHQERIQLYLQHLVFVTPLLLPAAVVEELELLCIWKLLYMFRVVSPPIITSAYNCIYSIWYLSHRYCYLSLLWKSWNCSASGNCSTCFGWYLHPSSRAHTTVSTACGICHTVIATCRCCGRVGTALQWKSWNFTAVPTLSQERQVAVTVWQILDAVDTDVSARDDGWRYHPKHVEQFPDINKLCNVASCWIYIGIYLWCTDP